MTINERIKYFRKAILHMNQTEFAKKLGMTQTGISYVERVDSNVTDQTIRTICLAFHVQEEWLRTGKEPMLVKEEKNEFSWDALFSERDITKLEAEIIKAYFDIDPTLRKKIIEHFKMHLLNSMFMNSAPAKETTYDEEARLLRNEADAVEQGKGKSSVLRSIKEA